MNEEFPAGLQVVDLINEGFIIAPAKTFGIYRGNRIWAVIEVDGSFVFGKAVYSSPSVAAGRAITTLFKVTSPERSYLSVNGWRFWQIVGRDGVAATIGELRSRLNTGR